METIKKRSDCPLSCSLDVFGDKWSLLIIRDLMFQNKCTYNDFLKSAEGIATNILSARLATLEENGIIEKVGISLKKTPNRTQVSINSVDSFLDNLKAEEANKKDESGSVL